VADRRRLRAAAVSGDTGRRGDERGTAPSMRRFRDEAREMHAQLCEQIVRQADTAIRP